MNPKLTTLSTTHPNYDPRDYSAPSKEAWMYMSKLPVYEDFPRLTIELPKEPRAYCLPLETVEIHMRYLDEWVGHFRRIGHGVPPAFFKSLPGISDVLFVDELHYTSDLDAGTIHRTGACVGKSNKFEDIFNACRHLRFEDSLVGAMTAFYFKVCFPNGDLPSLMFDDHHRTNRRDWWSKREPHQYGECLSARITIPWGLRLEIISEGHYLVSCLDFCWHDLYDINVELKDGIVGNPYPLLFNEREKEYRKSIELQEFLKTEMLIY